MAERTPRRAERTAKPVPEQVGEVLRTAYMEMADWVEEQIRETELCLSQWLALKFIADGRIRSIGDVTRALGISGGASTRLIDNLETQGLVTRVRPTNDRRLVTLALRPAGRRMVASVRTRLEQRWREHLGFLSASRQAEILSVLTPLVEALRAARQERAS